VYLIPRLAIVALALQALGAEFPELPNTESTSNEGPPSVGQSGGFFELPQPYGVSVWAGEPKVQNPIAMAWDAKGRMWVAENYTYGSRKVRFDLSLRDRVIVLADQDGDGVAEFRKVFTDQVQMLTSVEVGLGGVWLMCPPRLLFIPDRNGDLIPDEEPQVMLDGFDVARGNYHNFANGLRWGPDGWLYGRCGHSCPGKLGIPGTPEDQRIPIDGGIWRYHPQRKTVEVLAHGTVNPWGYDWDEHGELFFINTVIGHLWHLIPGAHYRESGSGASQNPLVYERMHQHADHFHYDTNLAWHKSRSGAANDFGGGHAHVGMAIYQAEHFPAQWRNRLLTWNQHGRRMNRERLERIGSGYVGRHESDVFRNSNEWFRGMEVSGGPDGAIYALDWSDTGECHDHTGVHRTSGRIYKFFHGSNPVTDITVLDNAAHDAESVLLHPNAWFARRWLLGLKEGRRKDSGETIRLCEGILDDPSKKGATRLRAMWGLHALGELKPEKYLKDSNEHVRTWAIRLLFNDQPMDGLFGPREKDLPTGNANLEKKLVALAKNDDSGLVRLALASTLQRLPVLSRGNLARALASRVEDLADHNLPMLVWYGITPMVDHDPQGLVEVARATSWPSLRSWIARALTARSKESPLPFNALLDLVSEPSKESDSLLSGIERAVLGMKGFGKPVKWDQVRANLGTHPRVLKLSVIFGDAEATQRMEKLVMNANAAVASRQQVLEILIESDSPNLRALCMKLLDEPTMKLRAARGLAKFDDLEIGEKLIDGLTGFTTEEQSEVVELLCGRASWAASLLQAIDSDGASKAGLTPYHAMQIHSLEDEDLKRKLGRVWGVVRDSPEELNKRKEELKLELNITSLAKADLGNGRRLYEQRCSSCHVLYGKGGKLGPDLTGSGRSNLDYLLENIVDPNSAVSADYRMNVIEFEDGRVLSGMIVGQDRNSLTLRLPGSENVIVKSLIKSRTALPNSIMPMGLLDGMGPQARRDLVGYLMHPKQVGR
jgi:putative membrane-bound dehydrogenase-like protein